MEFLSNQEFYSAVGLFVVLTLCLLAIGISCIGVFALFKTLVSRQLHAAIVLTINTSKYSSLKEVDIERLSQISSELKYLRKKFPNARVWLEWNYNNSITEKPATFHK
ncbi:hypothetical protein, partial [Denitromonas sp.]|uniref:hypothetical protein n=1 Tax=Denitromonas sp. TaxID=2734609 RepID=UPI003A898B77